MPLAIQVYQLIENEVGKEKAGLISKAIEDFDRSTHERIESELTFKKLELREDLLKELASKNDLKLEIQNLRTELKGDIQNLKGDLELQIVKLDKKFTIYFGILLFFIIFLNQNALTFIFKVLGLLK